MSDETHIIKPGDDPRFLPEFSAIREEINKSNHPSQPEVNWRLVESLALTLFKSNGVDLHTATYYTLARTKINGLSGFCEGCELLAGLITAEWERFWPGRTTRRAAICWSGLTPALAIFCAKSPHWHPPISSCFTALNARYNSSATNCSRWSSDGFPV